MSDTRENDNQAVEFEINKLYIKDAAFQMEGGADAFRREWQPELNVELDVQSNTLEPENTYEVVLKVKCQVNTNQQKAFTVEVDQAGIFKLGSVQGEEQLTQVLKGFCPNILYSYAREAIADMVVKGGFPQLNLAPVNFDPFKGKRQGNQADDAS